MEVGGWPTLSIRCKRLHVRIFLGPRLPSRWPLQEEYAATGWFWEFECIKEPLMLESINRLPVKNFVSYRNTSIMHGLWIRSTVHKVSKIKIHAYTEIAFNRESNRGGIIMVWCARFLTRMGGTEQENFLRKTKCPFSEMVISVGSLGTEWLSYFWARCVNYGLIMHF